MRQIVHPFRLAFALLALTALSGAGAAYTIGLNAPGNSTRLFDYGCTGTAILLAALLLLIAGAQRRQQPSAGFAPLMIFHVIAIAASGPFSFPPRPQSPWRQAMENSRHMSGGPLSRVRESRLGCRPAARAERPIRMGRG